MAAISPLCPVEDQYVAGEIVNRWFHREQSRRLKDMHELEMLKFDAELAELLFRRKQMLSRLGRNGQWSLWLRQAKNIEERRRTGWSHSTLNHTA